MSKHLILLFGVYFCFATVMGGTPAENFEDSFGTKSRNRAASSDGNAVAEFAAQLLSTAKSAEVDKGYQVLLLEKAFEFGRKSPLGYQTAIEASKLLGTLYPDRLPQSQKQILDIYQLRSATRPTTTPGSLI